MRPSVRPGPAAVVVCGALVAAVGLAQLGDGGPDLSTAPRGPYVALGDSYTSGPKIPARTGRPAGCARSDHNYPALVARQLKLKAADFRDMSCSGATVSDLSAPQTTGDGVNPAQLSALSTGTRLVTIGIGGNDIGFGALVTRCVKAGVFYRATGSGRYLPDDAPCRGQYVSAGTDEVRQRIEATGRRLAGALNAIGHRAPRARVYVVGYPAILPPGGTGCAREMSLAPGDVTFLHQEQQRLNTTLRQRAEAAGAGYVDTYTPSVGHDACSAQGTRWIEPLLPAVPAASVHPNARGERGMAHAVLEALHNRP